MHPQSIRNPSTVAGKGKGFARTFSGDSNRNTSATIISGGGLGTFFRSTGAFCGFACDMVDDSNFSGGLSLIILARRPLIFGFLGPVSLSDP